MNIYFAGSIRGGRHDKELYVQIIPLLSQYGRVLTDHVASSTLTDADENNIASVIIYRRDMS